MQKTAHKHNRPLHKGNSTLCRCNRLNTANRSGIIPLEMDMENVCPIAVYI